MKLTIITINYNNANCLNKTIESILNQAYNNYEYIIIDGGSTDSSVAIIQQYSTKLAYWISEPDKGIYNAMNKGITKANGEYCFFLNSGDYLVDENVLDSIFKNNPTEDVLFGNLYVTVREKIVGKAYGKEILTFSDVYAHTIKHQASFVKRELFTKFGMYNENLKIIADWEFYLKTVALNNATYKYFNIFVAYFDNDGISNRKPEVVTKEREMVISEYIPKLLLEDLEFLLKIRKYKRLFSSKITFFIIRLINKLF